MENENLKIYNAVRECPKEALKPISAGRLKGKSDINPMWRIKKLTELVGQLSKLVLKIVELLSYITLAEMAIKTIIQIWFNL